MKQETILRITGVGTAVAAYVQNEAITAAITAAFQKTDPVYAGVEVETTEGSVYFKRPEEGYIYTSSVVAQKFSDKRYYADRERVDGMLSGRLKTLRGKYHRTRR